MNRKLALFIFLLSSLGGFAGCSPSDLHGRQQESVVPPAVERNNKDPWQAANYRGLIMGKSKYVDMWRELGEPKRREQPRPQAETPSEREIWYVYENSGELPGKLIVAVAAESQTIQAIFIETDKLTEDEAIKHFGPDYIVTRYNHDSCLGNEESAPLYEAPNGAIAVVEYRNRGIAVSYNEEDKVSYVTWVSRPVGATESKCN